MSHFLLAAGEPVLIVGAMRSGKSNLTAWLLNDTRSVVVVDSKRHPDEWAKWGPQHGYVVTSDPDDILRHPRVVFQISTVALLDVSGYQKAESSGYAWTRALHNIMRRGNTVVVFDEVVHTLPAGRPHPVAMQIYTQGAAWGISPWGGSQFANRIETATVRAAVHCFAFRLNPYDLRLLSEKRGCDAGELGQLEPYAFGHHLTNEPAWTLNAPVDRVM